VSKCSTLTTGTQIGPKLTQNSVAVAGGIFVVQLDFGSRFPGAKRFFDIRVKLSRGGGFTLLLPLQSLGSTPYIETGCKRLFAEIIIFFELSSFRTIIAKKRYN